MSEEVVLVKDLEKCYRWNGTVMVKKQDCLTVLRIQKRILMTVMIKWMLECIALVSY